MERLDEVEHREVEEYKRAAHLELVNQHTQQVMAARRQHRA